MTRPRLDEETIELIQSIINKKPSIILEYGSGFYTRFLLESNENNIVITCETDKDFLRNTVESLPISCKKRLHALHLDIGTTREWGKPDYRNEEPTDDRMRKIGMYSITPWKYIEKEGIHPDFVLIDGRFRPTCLGACLIYTKKELTVLVDDYNRRTDYHYIEKAVSPIHKTEKAAIFKIYPNQLTARQVFEIILPNSHSIL